MKSSRQSSGGGIPFKLFVIIIAAIAIMGCSTLFVHMKKIKTYEMSIVKLQNEKKEKENHIEGLKRMIEYANSDDYIVQAARDELKWAFDGEIMFVDHSDEIPQEVEPEKPKPQKTPAIKNAEKAKALDSYVDPDDLDEIIIDGSDMN